VYILRINIGLIQFLAFKKKMKENEYDADEERKITSCLLT